MESDPDSVSLCEARERDLFHRSPVKRIREDAVVNHPAAAHVDAVMGKAKTRRNEVRAQRRLFMGRQKSIAAAKSGAGAAVIDRDASTARRSLRPGKMKPRESLG